MAAQHESFASRISSDPGRSADAAHLARLLLSPSSHCPDPSTYSGSGGSVIIPPRHRHSCLDPVQSSSRVHHRSSCPVLNIEVDRIECQGDMIMSDGCSYGKYALTDL